MNVHTVLWETPAVRLVRFGHAAHEPHRDPRREQIRTLSVNFVERDSFGIAHGRRVYRFDAGMIFLARPGFTYRTLHDSELPTDACLSICFPAQIDSHEIGAGLGEPALLPTNRLAYLRLGILGLAQAAGDRFGAEGWAMDLLAAVGEAASGHPSRPLFRNGQLEWYARRVSHVTERLRVQYASEHSLADLARSVHMSPYHFARVFRELTGMPPRRYLLSIRLAEARLRLRAGQPVTQTCAEVGFSNLSHFIRMFKRTYGVSPSKFR